MTASLNQNINVFIADPTRPEHRGSIWQILLDVDQEFVPPLSCRGSTTAMALRGGCGDSENRLEDYYQDIQRQVVILSRYRDQTIGFLTFKHHLEIAIIPDFSPCNYITTIAVTNSFRGQGAGRAMYDFILHRLPPDLESPFWVTRIWSGNDRHVAILNDFGFDLVKTIEDHRGAGIHTLYYVLRDALRS